EDLFEPETAAEAPGAARVDPQPRAGDAQREIHLHRLDRDVHAVRHVRLYDVDAVLVGPRAHAAGGELARHERLPAFGIAATESHDQQRARVGRRHPAVPRTRSVTAIFTGCPILTPSSSSQSSNA